MDYEKKCDYECTGQKRRIKHTGFRSTLKSSLLRLLNSDRGFEETSGAHKEIDNSNLFGYNLDRKMQYALLEAEQKKAAAIMWERRRRTIS